MTALRHPGFTPTPSLDQRPAVTVAQEIPGEATAVGFPVGDRGGLSAALGVGRPSLDALHVGTAVGVATALPPAEGGAVTVAMGVGDAALDATQVRAAAAAFGRAAVDHEHLALMLPAAGADRAATAQAAVEGVLLARYRYDPLRSAPATPLRSLTIVAEAQDDDAVRAGVVRGVTCAAAEMLARDLANTPHNYLTAADLADIAARLGAERGFDVEVFDEDALVELGCGGLLAINAGSAEPPRMIQLRYRPDGDETGRLALVGKGIMFDAGGISLKPSDASHFLMKTDMTGAGNILAAVAALRELGCTTAVTAYLMCTDNMPSGTATVLGDVVTIRGGTTVEMLDTDAEGRMVMADALVLAREDGHDAVVDMATLTGSVSRALGPDVAGLLGTSPELIAQVEVASRVAGEPVWQLPLHRPYRRMIESRVADMMNCAPIGNPDGIIAGLFLAEFAGDLPWAHIDIAGTAHTDAQRDWYPPGCTAFGTRLLLELVTAFVPPATTRTGSSGE